jgi:hypothetical protein
MYILDNIETTVETTAFSKKREFLVSASPPFLRSHNLSDKQLLCIRDTRLHEGRCHLLLNLLPSARDSTAHYIAGSIMAFINVAYAKHPSESREYHTEHLDNAD